MAINKKLIHFKTFANFNSQKLSANEANTKYTTGISGTETSGNPDILYQSICFIKDTQQIWTHGQIYNASADGGSDYVTIVKFNELFAEGTITTNESDVFNVVKTAMESNTPLLLCDNNYSIIQVSYYPLKVGSQIIASGILSQNVYNFTFTSGSNQITVTKLSVATLSNNLVSAQGLESPQGKTYALPNTDAEAWADDCLLTYGTGVYINKDYEGYDLGVVDGLYEERNGYPWALPNSDFSDVVGSEFTLASKGDAPAYYIADRTANPLVLRSLDNDTNCYPGKLISIYFTEQFQEDQNQTISINGNEYDLSSPTGLSANSGDTLLFVFGNDYIEPVQVSRAKELSTARSINGMNFRGSTNIRNFATCSTDASTANKIVSINNFTPNYGAQIRVQFDYSNTNAAPTLNVNNTGAKSMKYNGNAITNSNFTFDVNKIYTFTCRDSSWDLEGDWDKGINKFTMNSQSYTGVVYPDSFIRFYYSTGVITLNVSSTTMTSEFAEYSFEFNSGSTPTVFTYPSSWKWANGTAPTINANKTYHVSVVNNCAVIAEF